MKIFVLKDGNRLGPYTFDQLSHYRHFGAFQNSDPVWIEETDTWTQVDALLAQHSNHSATGTSQANLGQPPVLPLMRLEAEGNSPSKAKGKRYILEVQADGIGIVEEGGNARQWAAVGLDENSVKLTDSEHGTLELKIQDPDGSKLVLHVTLEALAKAANSSSLTADPENALIKQLVDCARKARERCSAPEKGEPILEVMTDGGREQYDSVSHLREALLSGRLNRHHQARWIEPYPKARWVGVQRQPLDKTEVERWHKRRAWRSIGDGLANEEPCIVFLYEPVMAFGMWGAQIMQFALCLFVVLPLTVLLFNKVLYEPSMSILAWIIRLQGCILAFAIGCVLMGIPAAILGGAAGCLLGALIWPMLRPFTKRPPEDGFESSQPDAEKSASETPQSTTPSSEEEPLVCTCPHCDNDFSLMPDQLGVKLSCPHCSEHVLMTEE